MKDLLTELANNAALVFNQLHHSSAEAWQSGQELVKFCYDFQLSDISTLLQCLQCFCHVIRVCTGLNTR